MVSPLKALMTASGGAVTGPGVRAAGNPPGISRRRRVGADGARPSRCAAPCSDDESDLGHPWESFGLTPVTVGRVV